MLPRFVEISKDTFVPLEDIDRPPPRTPCSRGCRSSATTCSGSRATPTSRSPTRPTTCCRRSRTSCAGAGVRRGRPARGRRRAWTRRCAARLIEWLDVDEIQVYDVDGLLDLGDLWQIAGIDGIPELRQPPWTPVTHPAFGAGLRQHRRAARHVRGDARAATSSSTTRTTRSPPASSGSSSRRSTIPNVLAIKMTVYRTSDDSALVPSLIEAAEKGKQAVCMVELKARFDERQNIRWSRALEEVGAHVVHGIPGLKTHAKAILVVRRERGGVRHYVMIGTGNFHAKNARLYEDFGLFTTDPEIGEEVANLFNTLTGYGHPEPPAQGAGRARLDARARCSSEIERTVAGAPRRPARPDRDEDELARRPALHRGAVPRLAGRACRSTSTCAGSAACGPACPAFRETINVVSVVGRFLEHSRIYSFHRGDEQHLLHRLGRPDAAQPRHPRRAARRRSSSPSSRPSSTTRSSAAWPTTPSPGRWPPTATWTPAPGPHPLGPPGADGADAGAGGRVAS